MKMTRTALPLLLLAAVGMISACNSDQGVRAPDLPGKRTISVSVTCSGAQRFQAPVGFPLTCTGPQETCEMAAGRLTDCAAVCKYRKINERGNEVLVDEACDDSLFQFASSNAKVLTLTAGASFNSRVGEALSVTNPTTVVVTATDQGVSGSTNIKVTPALIDQVVEIFPKDGTVPSGQTVRYKAFAKMTDKTVGEIGNGIQAINWSDAAIANTTRNVDAGGPMAVTFDVATSGKAETPNEEDPLAYEDLPNGLPDKVTITGTPNLASGQFVAGFDVAANTKSTTLQVVEPQLIAICVELANERPAYAGTGCTPRPLIGDQAALKDLCPKTEVALNAADGPVRFFARGIYSNNYACDITDKNRGIQGGANLEALVPRDFQTHWASSDVAIATVSDNPTAPSPALGTVTPIATGTADITAECCKITGKRPVRVAGADTPVVRTLRRVDISDNPADGPISNFTCVGSTDLLANPQGAGAPLPAQKRLFALTTYSDDVRRFDVTALEQTTWNQAVAGYWDAAANNGAGACATGPIPGFDQVPGGGTPALVGNVAPGARYVAGARGQAPTTDNRNTDDKGVARSVADLRLAVACIPPVTFTGEGSNGAAIARGGMTVLVLPATNDRVDTEELCRALEPVVQGGSNLLYPLLAGLSTVLTPIFANVGDPIPTETILSALQENLGVLTIPVGGGLAPVVDGIQPLTDGLGCVLDALIGNQDPAALANCGP